MSALPWLNRVDDAYVSSLAARAPVLVTLDNHYRVGGQGQYVLTALATANVQRMPRCLQLGLDACPPSGRNDEVLDAVGLDGARIAERIRAFIGSGARAA